MTRKKLTNRWCFPAHALLESFGEGEWASNIGAVLGVSRTRIQQWRKGTTNLDPYQADKFAIKLGKHPSEIWTDWFDLPEYHPPQEQTQCQHTNATTAETTSSQPNIASGDTTCQQPMLTSSSASTTTKSRKR